MGSRRDRNTERERVENIRGRQRGISENGNTQGKEMIIKIKTERDRK